MCISHLQPRSIYIFASANIRIYYAPTMMFRRIVSVHILKVNNIKEHFFRMIHGIRSINYGPDREDYRISQVAWCNLRQLVQCEYSFEMSYFSYTNGIFFSIRCRMHRKKSIVITKSFIYQLTVIMLRRPYNYKYEMIDFENKKFVFH